jgi:hypothetical protein
MRRRRRSLSGNVPARALRGWSCMLRGRCPLENTSSGCLLELAGRKPMLLVRFVGVLLLRWAARQFCALLFHAPPRITRLSPALPDADA